MANVEKTSTDIKNGDSVDQIPPTASPGSQRPTDQNLVLTSSEMDRREPPRPPGESAEKNNTAMVKQTTSLPPAFQAGPQGPSSPRFPTNNEYGGARLNSPQTQQQQQPSLRRSDSRSSLQTSQPPLGPGSLQAGGPLAPRPQRFLQRSPQPQFYPGPNQNFQNLQPGTPKRFPLPPNQGLRGSLTTRPRSLVTGLQAPRPQSPFPPNSLPYNNGVRFQQNSQQDSEQGSPLQTNLRSDLTGESRPETLCSRRPPMNDSQPQLVSGPEALPLQSNQDTAPQGNELLRSDSAESTARDQNITSRSLSSEKMVAETEKMSEGVSKVKMDDSNSISALENKEDAAEMVKLSTDDDNNSSMRFDKAKNNQESCHKPNNELLPESEDAGLHSSQMKIFHTPKSESPQSLKFENSQPSKLKSSQPLRASEVSISSDSQRTEYASLTSNQDEHSSSETLEQLPESDMDGRISAIGSQSSVSASAVSAPKSPKFSVPLENASTPSSAALQSDLATTPDFVIRSPVFESPMTPRPENMKKSSPSTPQLPNLPKSPGCLKSFDTEKSGKSSPDTEGSKKRATFAKDLIMASTKEDISTPSTPSDLKVPGSTTADESSKGAPMTSPKRVPGTPKKSSSPSLTDRVRHRSRSPKSKVGKSPEKESEAKRCRSARESKERARIWENRSKKPEGDNDSGVDESTQGHEPTTNGDAGSPTKSHSKIPGPKRSTSSSPTKSPSKSAKALPKTPENNVSTSASTDMKKKVPMNKIQVGAAPSPNLKTVRSKIGSLENTSHKPGGGKIKIENRKLDFSKAQPKIAAKNDKYTPSGGDKKITQVKLQWNAKPKVGSLDNATYKPGGGDKKIETVKLDFKEKAKPKIGSKENVKHVPGGGTVKIETVKLEVKAESKVGSLDNVKHKPGGGDKKIFDDKDYLRQTSSNVDSLSGSSSQSPVPTSAINEGRNGLPTSDENLNQEC